MRCKQSEAEKNRNFYYNKKMKQRGFIKVVEECKYFYTLLYNLLEYQKKSTKVGTQR